MLVGVANYKVGGDLKVGVTPLPKSLIGGGVDKEGGNTPKIEDNK